MCSAHLDRLPPCKPRAATGNTRARRWPSRRLEVTPALWGTSLMYAFGLPKVPDLALLLYGTLEIVNSFLTLLKSCPISKAKSTFSLARHSHRYSTANVATRLLPAGQHIFRLWLTMGVVHEHVHQERAICGPKRMFVPPVRMDIHI